jgi:hypothetical protein
LPGYPVEKLEDMDEVPWHKFDSFPSRPHGRGDRFYMVPTKLMFRGLHLFETREGVLTK